MPGRRLDFQERCELQAMWTAGSTQADIARTLGRSASTVSREVARNNSARHGPKHGEHVRQRSLPAAGGSYRWGYSAAWAQRHATTRARRPKQVKLARAGAVVHAPARGFGHLPDPATASAPASGLLRALVRSKLAARWSPAQISGWLAENFPAHPELQVSHETIYQALYVQARGNLRTELGRQVALRSGRTHRRSHREVAGAVRSARWTADLNISARPPEAADRAIPGHWEGDLVIGADGESAIITLVERTTRYAMLGALAGGRTSPEVINVLSALAGRLPAHLRRSLTWDCGSEMATHTDFTTATGCPVFFADPHSPWQRGSNENTNGLLRQYYPKGVTDFHTLTQADLDATADELNGRPRQTLGWKNPRQALNDLLVATTP